MTAINHYIIFSIDSERFAFPVGIVERVIRAVEVSPLPDASANIMGIINMEGTIISVFNTRRKLGLPERELSIDDRFIITAAGDRKVAIAVDSADGIIGVPQKELTPAGEIEGGLIYTEGAIKTGEGVILTLDIGNFIK
ncbi:MAG: chemotaxis protein CheW [Spirochaetota bacterium]